MTQSDPVLSACGKLADALAINEKTSRVDAVQRLVAVVDAFLSLDFAGRDEVRGLLSPEEGRGIANLGVLAAELAIEQKRDDYIRYALLAHEVEGFSDDPRNNYRLLVTAWYAAEELALDPRQTFESAAEVMSPTAAKYIKSFAARNPSLNSLDVMEVRRVDEEGKVRFLFG